MMSRKKLQASPVKSNGIWTLCFLAAVCMFLVCSCGGGDSSSPAAGTGTGTGTSGLFTTSDSSSVTLAKVSGTAITAHSVDLMDQEVYSGAGTLSGNTFTVNFSLYPAGGATVFSATGSIDASGNSVTATITPGNQTVTLTKTTSSVAGVYYGTYSGSSSGTFVAGIDGNGNIRGFDGNDTDGWSSFATTLSGSSFTATQSDGTRFTGSISGGASGTWTNTGAGQSGTFTGPKVF